MIYNNHKITTHIKSNKISRKIFKFQIIKTDRLINRVTKFFDTYIKNIKLI